MLYVIATCKSLFFIFILFFYFFKFFFYQNMGQKLGSNRCPPLYNAYEAKLLNVLHSKLVKKKSLPCLLSDPLIQGLYFLKENLSRYHG